jgi:hypothetical protein
MEGSEDPSAKVDTTPTDATETPAASPVYVSGEEAFMKRAEGWRQRALLHPDDRQGCIDAITAGLSKHVYLQQAAIDRSIEHCKSNLLDSPTIQAAFTVETGMARQLRSYLSFQASLEQRQLNAERRKTQIDPLRKGSH